MNFLKLIWNLKEGVTPLHAACYWNKEEFVSCLLNAGANVDAQTEVIISKLFLF